MIQSNQFNLEISKAVTDMDMGFAVGGLNSQVDTPEPEKKVQLQFTEPILLEKKDTNQETAEEASQQLQLMSFRIC